MKRTFACAVRPNKAPSMRCGLSIIGLEHAMGSTGAASLTGHSWHQSALLRTTCYSWYQLAMVGDLVELEAGSML